MTDEEKKAIEYFKEKIKNKLPLYEEIYIDGKPYRINILQLETNFTEKEANNTEKILNLIEKQSKEIEELKVNNKKLQDKCKELIFEKQELTSTLLDSTPKDKIKAKIEEINNEMLNKEKSLELFYRKKYCKEILQSLLEKK